MRAEAWNEKLRKWRRPCDEAERRKYQEAEARIQEALDESALLRRYRPRVFTHGSYRNHTTVSRKSDIDLCVCCRTSDLWDPSLLDRGIAIVGRLFGKSAPPRMTFRDFKNELERCLVKTFPGHVTRGNKAIHVNKLGRSRVDADVLPCFAQRTSRKSVWGIGFRTDDGRQILSWPLHHRTNGNSKNERTSSRYKPLVRILKHLRTELKEKNERLWIPSYLIECLAWNVPNEDFRHSSYLKILRNALAHGYNGTAPSSAAYERWREIHCRRGTRLFSPDKRWSRATAHTFFCAAWDYVGFDG